MTRVVTIGGYTPAQIRKTVEAVVGLVLIVAGQVLTTVTDAPGWLTTSLTTVLGIATALRVFLAQNAPTVPVVVDDEPGKHAA